MAKWVGRLLLLGGALAVVALVVLALGASRIDPDRLAVLISQRVRAATGREFAVTGGVRLRIFPRIAIVADGVRVGSAPGSSGPDLLRARRLEGDIPLLPLFRGVIQLDRLVLVEPDIHLEAEQAEVAIRTTGEAGASAPKPPPSPERVLPLTLSLETIILENGSASWRDGKSGAETKLSLERLTVKRPAASTMNSLDFSGALQGRPFTLTGQVGPLEAFLLRGKPLTADLAVAAGGATGTFVGTIDRSGGGPLLAGMVKVRVAGTPERAKTAGDPDAASIPLDLAGKLTVEKNVSRLEGLEIAYGAGTASGSAVLRLDTAQPELTAALAATWRNTETGRELRLAVDRLTLRRDASSTLDSLELAGSFRGQALTLSGRVGPLEEFVSGRSPLGADLALATEGASASFAGKIDRGGGAPLVAGKLRVRIAETSGVGKLAGTPLTLPVPFDLAGKLTVGAGTWGMEGLEIATPLGKVSGSIALRRDTPQPELTAALSAAWSTRETGEEVRLTLDRLTVKRAASAATDTLDLAGSLRGQQFTLTGQVGSLEKFLAGRDPLAIDIAFATEGATVALAGKIDRGGNGPFLDCQLKAHIEGTSGLAGLAGRPLTLPLPLDVAGQLTVKEKTWRLDGLEIASGHSRVSGSAIVRLDTPRPELTASIDAPFIDLPELLGWKREQEHAAAVRGRRLFSDAPLPFETLRGLDGRLDLKAARLKLADWLQLESAHLGLGLRDGRLLVDPLRFVIAGGAVTGTAEVAAASGHTPQVALTLEGDGISLERWVTDAGFPQVVAGGSVDLEVHFSASGASARDLMSGLDGELRLSCGPARLTSVALAPGDILTGILGTINPFRTKDRFTDLTCAVVRLPARNGLVTIDRTVAYETVKVASAVAGTIALGSEALDLAIKPTVKSGFGLVGAPGQAEFVRIAGTLAEPKIELRTLTAARTALSAGGAVATAGLSLIGEALFKKAASDSQPCKTALEKKIPGEGTSPRQAPAPKP